MDLGCSIAVEQTEVGDDTRRSVESLGWLRSCCTCWKLEVSSARFAAVKNEWPDFSTHIAQVGLLGLLSVVQPLCVPSLLISQSVSRVRVYR